MEKKYIIGFVAGITLLVVAILIFTGRNQAVNTSPYDLVSFGQCLTDKGAKFYGAFWCQHCQATKRLLGEGMSKVTYIECSTPDSQGQLPVCKEKNIASYPTWIFADESRLTGELTLTNLAEKTGCPLNLIASSTPQ